MNKFYRYLLIFCFLLPLNLFAERDYQNYGEWRDVLDIDDFTDKKTFSVYATAEDRSYRFSIIYYPNGSYLYYINIFGPDCESYDYNNNKIKVLFRVDKNKVFTLPMKKAEEGFFETDINEVRDRNMYVDYYNYKEEMAKGDILRVRVNTSSCKKDLKFDLKGFDEAIKRLREEFAIQLSS